MHRCISNTSQTGNIADEVHLGGLMPYLPREEKKKEGGGTKLESVRRIYWQLSPVYVILHKKNRLLK